MKVTIKELRSIIKEWISDGDSRGTGPNDEYSELERVQKLLAEAQEIITALEEKATPEGTQLGSVEAYSKIQRHLSDARQRVYDLKCDLKHSLRKT